jgi:GntR family transcriptional regulator
MANAQPLNLQILSVLRGRLEAGKWRVGDQLPTIDALVEEFGVSRVTVRQALDALEREGIISKRRGSGTKVERDLTRTRWVNLPSTMRELLSSLRELEADVLTTSVTRDVPLEASVDTAKAAKYIRMQRVHSLQGVPYCLVDLYLDELIYRRNPRLFQQKPVLHVIAQKKYAQIAHARQTLTVRTADVPEAESLNIDVADPVAEIKRIVLDAKSRLIYAATILYPSQFVRLT